MRVRLLIPFLVLALAGCGDDFTGPGELSGTWQYTVTDLATLTPPIISCTVTGMTVGLTQTGTTLTGTTHGGNMACIGGQSGTITNGMTLMGAVEGGLISFEIGTPPIQHHGALKGNTISGYAIYSMAFLTLVGRFELKR